MKIDSSTLSQLLSSLSEYNPRANEIVEKMALAIVPVAMIILGCLMFMEMSDTNRRLQVEQGRMNNEVFVSIAWKYMLAFILIMASSQIFDAIIWFGNAIGHLISEVTGESSDLSIVVPQITGKLNTVQKMIINGLNALAHFFIWFAEIIVRILVFLRFVQLLLYKAAAPVLVASYISEEWRTVATGYIRKFIACVIQGFLLIIILKIYPALVANDMFKLVVEGSWLENLAALFSCIMKSVVMIFVLLGSQQKAKEWMGG